jgi:hypothetical protein
MCDQRYGEIEKDDKDGDRRVIVSSNSPAICKVCFHIRQGSFKGMALVEMTESIKNNELLKQEFFGIAKLMQHLFFYSEVLDQRG